MSTRSPMKEDLNTIPDDQLPNWFLLKKFQDLEIDINIWAGYADNRVDKFLRENIWSITIDDPKEEKQEAAGHLLLRLAASTNPRLASWLVEKEGDLFSYRYRNASLKEKLNIAKKLFGSSHVRTIEDLELDFGKDIITRFDLVRLIKYKSKRYEKALTKTGKPAIRAVSEIQVLPPKDGTHVAFYFSAVPDVISERKTLLYLGWAIAPMFVFHLSIKRAFETQLRERIEESVERLKLDKRVANLANRLAKKMEDVVSIPKHLDLEGDLSEKRLYRRYDLFPLCSRDLIAILLGKGHLSHHKNLQLGFFLKALEMPLDEQLWFWYENSIDNVGLTFEEYERKVGYLIRHIYGLEGRKIDYHAPKCETIFKRYYCPFIHRPLENIEVLVRENLNFSPEALTEKGSTLSKIQELSATRQARAACSLLFELKFGRKISIWHPVQYIREALLIQKTLSEKNERKNTKNES